MKKSSMKSGTNEGGTASTQDRSNQPKRAGGNCADFDIEQHGQSRGTRIGIGPKGSKGADGEFGPTRQNGNGNTPVTGEKHGSKGSEFVLDLGRPKGGKLIPDRIQVDDRGMDTAGNNSGAGREKSGQKKAEYVKENTRFDR
jgi:hypothetical protein